MADDRKDVSVKTNRALSAAKIKGERLRSCWLTIEVHVPLKTKEETSRSIFGRASSLMPWLADENLPVVAY